MRKKENGFTRADLLAVAGVLFVAVMLGIPSRARGRDATQSLLCLNNLGALVKGWQMYAEDYGGIFPLNPTISEANQVKGNEWAAGYLDWTNGRYNTNTAVLAQLPFSGYLPGIDVYRCPGDVYRSASQSSSRIRSYSMNSFIGSDFVLQAGWRRYKMVSDLVEPSPSELFVLIQEHPDSINDPFFVPPMDGPTWLDIPFGLHDGAGALAFADGHTEAKLWQPSTRIPVRFNFFNPTPSTADTAWLRARSSARP